MSSVRDAFVSMSPPPNHLASPSLFNFISQEGQVATSPGILSTSLGYTDWKESIYIMQPHAKITCIGSVSTTAFTVNHRRSECFCLQSIAEIPHSWLLSINILFLWSTTKQALLDQDLLKEPSWTTIQRHNCGSKGSFLCCCDCHRTGLPDQTYL